MKNIIIVAFITCFITVAKGQDKILLSQYFQNMPAFNPALTGVNDFLDFRMGYRQQWMGFQGAPRTLYLSGYGALNGGNETGFQRSIRTSEAKSRAKSTIKHGVGGSMHLDEQGPYQQMEVNLNYAVHVPVSANTYLSFGVIPALYNAKVDFSKAEVRDALTDQAYQNFLTNGASGTFFQLSSGIALYSERYYAAYSAMQMTRTLISGNENLHTGNGHLRHQVMGGYRFYLNQDFELVPNALVRLENAVPLVWDAGARVQYKGQFWMGASYRNDNSLIGMLGMLYNDKVRISYSYEYKSAGVDDFNSSSHELVLGLQLFNHSKYVSMW